jgi:hypothetical protein
MIPGAAATPPPTSHGGKIVTIGLARRRAKPRWLGLAGVVVILVGLGATAALAVHDEGVFGLEGNAITGGTACTDTAQTVPAGCEPANPASLGYANTDWDKVYNHTSGAEATSFISDTTLTGTLQGQGDTILSQDTKDIQDVSEWTWKQTTTTSVQDKDDIEHAYAAQFNIDRDPGTCGSLSNQDPCVLLYFGADRYSNSGDAVMGFWLLQDKVEPLGPNAQGNGTFSGHHTARVDGATPGDPPVSRGDVLIVSDFRSGGKAPQIQIYEWVDSGGSASTHLDQIAGSTSPASCTQAPPEGGKDKNPVPPVSTPDDYCATANQFAVHSPWKFNPKSNSGGTAGNGTLGTPVGTNPDANTKFGVAEFMEGGINMTALGLGNECFNTFYAESRASHAVTSTLSDFAIGGFGQCGATFDTQTSKTMLEIGETAPTDTATVHVTSTGGNPPAPTGDVNFYLCFSSTTQITSCDPTGKTTFDTETLGSGGPTDYSVTSIAPTISSAGYYCFAARWEGDTTYDDGPYGDDGTNECFQVTPKQATISTQVNTEDPVAPGDEVYDTATLGNTAAPSNGTNGTITFTAYATDDPTCSGDPVYTSVITVTGDGAYRSKDGDANSDGVPAETDDEFHPTTPGTYNWIAAYAPDAGDVNNLSKTTGCGDDHESSVVRTLQPTMDTAQSFVPNDSATITVTDEAGALAGTVLFELFVDDETCSGDAAYTSAAIDITSGTGSDYSKTVMSDNATAYGTDGTTFTWVVTYTSSNSGHESVSSPCGNETSSITIDNGDQQPPAGP